MVLPARRPFPMPRSGSLAHVLIVLDYDGTVTTHECNEIALTAAVGDAWRPFEEMVHRGEIGHAECFDRQVRLIDVPRERFIAGLIDAAEPAPGLRDFLSVAAAGGARVVVLSAGFREAIEAVWHRHGLPPAEIVASELVGADGDGGGPPYHIGFNPQLGDCERCGPESCKATVLRARRRPGDVVWVFGDGDSDFCPAREADLVFARGRLAQLAEEAGLPWRRLDFVAAADELAGLAELERSRK
ncbi:MAG: haloacid dehalogenase-like hydrolase [Thermoleophilia bacterium]|nr:haloacid dehalogenase-like hydrolase [Thermoleophilia bacterium]